MLKVGFFQKVLAKFSHFSKCHSCEPKIVNYNYKTLVILWIDLVIKSPHYEIWLKKCKLYGWVLLFTMLAKSRNYWLHPKYIFEQAFYRLILLIQKNEKINILSVPFINLNFPPSSGAKKDSHEWHFGHFINIFWVKRTFTYFHNTSNFTTKYLLFMVIYDECLSTRAGKNWKLYCHLLSVDTDLQTGTYIVSK